jgi:hypothetical protein
VVSLRLDSYRHETGTETLVATKLGELAPNLEVLDLRYPGSERAEILRSTLAAPPRLRVLLLSEYIEVALVTLLLSEYIGDGGTSGAGSGTSGGSTSTTAISRCGGGTSGGGTSKTAASSASPPVIVETLTAEHPSLTYVRVPNHDYFDCAKLVKGLLAACPALRMLDFTGRSDEMSWPAVLIDLKKK